MKNIFITGVSSGLGEALALAYLENGDSVYAVGRRAHPRLETFGNFFFFHCDLAKTGSIGQSLKAFVQDHGFDIAILNAGVLGDISPLKDTDTASIKAVMEVNVWANKEIIDTLSEYASPKQVVGISSGAAVNGSKGWGAYALSKASLNMLLNVYAKELPAIHFTALAPGVVDTNMVRHITREVDETQFPSVTRLKNGPILSPREAALRLIETFPKLLAYESGSFLDVRKMD